MSKKKDARRADWLAEFERALIAISPAHAGKINWDAALFFFNAGKLPKAAASDFAATEAPVKGFGQ